MTQQTFGTLRAADEIIDEGHFIGKVCNGMQRYVTVCNEGHFIGKVCNGMQRYVTVCNDM